MGVATLGLWLMRAAGRTHERWLEGLRFAGHAALVGLFVSGGVHFISDVREIGNAVINVGSH